LDSSETQPCLPSGQIIDAKNTLQSFAQSASPRGSADGNLNIASEEGINSSNDPSTAVAVEVEISPTVNAEPIDSVALANLYNARNNWQQQQIPHPKGKLIFLMCYISTIVVVAMVAGVGVYCGVGNCSPDGSANILTSAPMQVGAPIIPLMQSNFDNTSIISLNFPTAAPIANCSLGDGGVECCATSDCANPTVKICESNKCLGKGNPRFTLTWIGDGTC
jgi:hypothetical protein